MIRGLIFDFDGLILETESPIFQSWQELYQAHGCVLTIEMWASIIGTAEELFDPLVELDKQAGRRLDRASIAPQRLQREKELIAAQTVMPGVKDYLHSARQLGLKTAVASSSDREWVTGHLERIGLLNFFDCIKTREDVHSTKPDPALFLAALACLGLRPNQAIVFEDSPNGIRASKEARIFCVAVPNAMTRGLPLDQADVKIDSLMDLSLHALLQLVNSNNR